jgi:hypothetical protein
VAFGLPMTAGLVPLPVVPPGLVVELVEAADPKVAKAMAILKAAAKLGAPKVEGTDQTADKTNPGLVFWLNQGEQRLRDCRQGQG